MAPTFTVINHGASPFPLAERLFAVGLRTTGNLLRSIRRSTRALYECVSVSPVSQRWLLEHQIASSKHCGEVVDP
jgi:hypothetical protein